MKNRSRLEETAPVECSISTMEFILRSVFSNALHALLQRSNPCITIKRLQAGKIELVSTKNNGTTVRISIPHVRATV